MRPAMVGLIAFIGFLVVPEKWECKFLVGVLIVTVIAVILAILACLLITIFNPEV